MATLAELNDSGQLHKLELDLPSRRQPERLFYASPRLRDWLVETLPNLGSEWSIELTAEEQVSDLLERFCAGEELAVGPTFHMLHPGDAGVWELKTPDVRIFGWFAFRDCFVGFVGDSASRVKRHGLYRGYVGDTVRFRDQLPLDPPKFVPDEDPHAVVSNYHFP